MPNALSTPPLPFRDRVAAIQDRQEQVMHRGKGQLRFGLDTGGVQNWQAAGPLSCIVKQR